MDNIEINDFLNRVDKAILWLTEGIPTGTCDIGITKSIGIENKELEVLKELIKEAPDDSTREWLEKQFDKKTKAINLDCIDLSETTLQDLKIEISVARPRESWIEEIHHKTDDAKEEAKKIVSSNKIKKYLCPALQNLSNDTFEIAKVTTPILLGLVAGGILTIPLSPMLFAAIAFMIARSGIVGFCDDYNFYK